LYEAFKLLLFLEFNLILSNTAGI